MTHKTDSWNPAQYEKFKNERSQPFYDLMALLQTVKDAEIVDLGCGSGELTQELHKQFQAKQTLGIDSSQEMLKKATAFAESGLSFQHANIESWKPSATFDIIFSNAAIQWCENHHQLLAQFRMALRPGGQMAIQMPMNHDYPTHLIAHEMAMEKSWAKKLGDEGYNKQSYMLSIEDYAQLLFDLGFKERLTLVKVYGHVLESRADVIEWVKGTLLTFFKSRLNESDYELFVDEFRERLFVRLPDTKPFFYPFKRILIWGRI